MTFPFEPVTFRVRYGMAPADTRETALKPKDRKRLPIVWARYHTEVSGFRHQHHNGESMIVCAKTGERDRQERPIWETPCGKRFVFDLAPDETVGAFVSPF